MHKKIRQKYDILVTWDQVYDVMSDLDPDGLPACGGVGAKKVRCKKDISLQRVQTESIFWMDMIT